jgi:hypothetical protein
VVPVDGAPDQHYSVVVHVRGVAELRRYTGGMSTSTPWYVGGTFARDGWNAWKLSSSSSPQVYYLNAGPTNMGGSSVELDFEQTIEVAGMDTLSLSIESVDDQQIKNVGASGAPIVPAGIPPAPNAYDGQFVQVDFVSATPL